MPILVPATPTPRQTLLGSALLFTGLVILIVGCVSACLRTGDDISNHLLFGQRFLHGQYLYADGLDYVYPPFWAMAFSLLAPLPIPLAKIILTLLGFAGLVVLLRLLQNRLLQNQIISSRNFTIAYWTTVLSLALVLPALTRDLADCLTNTFLVALAWFAIDAWSRRRPWPAAAALGLAIALKCTPALFLLYFLWKKQWKMLLATLAFCLLFTLLPLLRQGWTGDTGYYAHMKDWTGHILSSLRQPDPSQGVLGNVQPNGLVYEDKLNNLALKPALARYLMKLPYGHLGRPETSDDLSRPNDPPNPYYFDFLTLPPPTAGLVAKSLLALLVLCVFLSFRPSPSQINPPIGVPRLLPSSPRDDPAVPYQCAAIALLMLLLSPVTWKQHCVWALPALFLIARAALLPRPSRLLLGILIFYLAAFILPDRSLIGRPAASLLESFHIKTFALLALLFLTLILARSASLPDSTNANSILNEPRP